MAKSEIGKPGIELAIAEKLLVKFDGNKSKFFEFIDNCDKALQLVDFKYKDILFQIIQTKLTDNARSIIRNRCFESWDQLKSYLSDIYVDRRTASQWQAELNMCRQKPGESVISFSNRLENCYLKLVNSLKLPSDTEQKLACIELIKDQALNIFISGLGNELVILVKAQRPTSLEQAISIALSEERELKFRNAMRNNYITKPFCDFCKMTNHDTNKCRKRTVRHFSTPSKPPITCKFCKKLGHTINDCFKLKNKNAFNEKNKQPLNG